MSRFLSSLMRTKHISILKSVQGRNEFAAWNLRTQKSLSAARRLHLSSARQGSAGEGYHRPSDFDKKILVWSKMYPDVAGVPEEVTNSKMKKAKDMFRIRVNILMAIATMGLCVLYIVSGKRAVERGESIHQQNRERHTEFQKKD